MALDGMENYCWQDCRLPTITCYNSELSSEAKNHFYICEVPIVKPLPIEDNKDRYMKVKVAIQTHNCSVVAVRDGTRLDI
jgi:hypothetical protein